MKNEAAKRYIVKPLLRQRLACVDDIRVSWQYSRRVKYVDGRVPGSLFRQWWYRGASTVTDDYRACAFLWGNVGNGEMRQYECRKSTKPEARKIHEYGASLLRKHYCFARSYVCPCVN